MQKSLATPIYLLFLIPLMISLACNMPLIANTGTNPSGTISPPPSQTQTVPMTDTSEPPSPTTTSTSTTTPVPPTDTSTATFTVIPPTATETQPATPCNRAQFVSDVNYSDGSQVFVDSNFTKTWRLMNTGSCSWTSGYRIIFESGDRMSAPDETVLTSGSIPPGATADISVDLKAPSATGNYRGYFRLKSPDNVVFGINGSSNDAFWVDINAIKFYIKLPATQFHLFPTPTPTFHFIIPPLSKTLKPLFP